MPQASDGGQASSEGAHQVCGDSEKYKVLPKAVCALARSESGLLLTLCRTQCIVYAECLPGAERSHT